MLCFKVIFLNYTKGIFHFEFTDQVLYRYSDVKLPVRMFDAWAAVAINCNVNPKHGIAAHRDVHDYLDGLCWTIPFGPLESGGNLKFPELNVELEYGTGDVAAFQSLQVHQVEPFSGERFSLVLFSHNNVFIECKSK